MKKIITSKEFHGIFDVLLFSCEVKMTKDSHAIFLLALDKLKLKPEECIFVDDTKKFVEVARSLGINAIQFKNAEQLKSDLINFDINL